MTDLFSLSPSIDTHVLKAAFAEHGRVEILDFLGAGQAMQLREHVAARPDWSLVMNAGANVYEIPRSSFADMAPEQKSELEQRLIEAARSGFQYRYEAIRVPDSADERAAREGLLDRFVEFMSSRPVLDLLSEICGFDVGDFADGQATAYSSGHFLTRHDDNVAGKNRRAAYVFGLSPQWRAEWGGLLMFHGRDGNIEEGFVPAIGALRVFLVPCEHSVSYVTPFAPEQRMAVTGWLRASG